MFWTRCRSVAAATRRLSILTCAIGAALIPPEAPSLAQNGPMLILPAHDEALPGQRIGWRFDDMKGALTQANVDGKPLMIVFVADPCGWCRIFLAHVLRCDGFNALAGRAHFMISTNVRDAAAKLGDEDVSRLRLLLKVEDYPTAALISVKGGVITPVAKISGATSEAALLGHLAKAGLRPPATPNAAAQSAAIGLPKPAACGERKPEEALESSSPRRVQHGMSR